MEFMNSKTYTIGMKFKRKIEIQVFNQKCFTLFFNLALQKYTADEEISHLKSIILAKLK